MVAALVLAGIISILSIFVFFGDAFSNTGGTAIPNMFQLMFGGSGTYSGYIIAWKQYGWMTFLFVVQIIIMIVAVISFVIAYGISEGNSDEDSGVGIAILSGILSLVALIVSFCTLAITDINQGGYFNVKLGFGPIFYSILHIIVIVVLIIGIIYQNSQSTYKYNSYSSNYTQSSYVQRMNATSKPQQSSQAKTKGDLDFQLKFGLITKDEYDEKLEELNQLEAIKEEAKKQPNEPEKKTLSTAQKASLKANLDVQLESGLITQEEYDNRIKWIDEM